MNKKIFVTGEAKITSLLRDYITAKMEADFCFVDGSSVNTAQLEYARSADYIILLHGVGKCTAEEAEKDMLLTGEIIQSLPVLGVKGTIAGFVPRRSGSDDDEVRAIRMQSERIVQEYSQISGTKVVLYRMPEIFGGGFDNEVIDRLISEQQTENPDASYEFIHINDFLYEIYRMVNGAPAYMGHDSFAYPQDTFFSTEASLVKVISGFKSLKPWAIPDFPSPFERCLYDYYLQHTTIVPSCKIEGEVAFSSQRFGEVSVKRLNPGEAWEVALNGVSGARLLLLWGSISVDKGGEYCADSSMIRINLTENTVVRNIGDSIAVMEMWSHTIS